MMTRTETTFFEPFDAELLLREVQVENYDAIVFIGGAQAEQLTNGVASSEVDRIISEARSQSVPLGGICVGLNILKNSNVTEVRQMLTDATDERLMTFDGIVTAVENSDVEAFVGRLLSQ
jgi:imidazoleglycerol phosphate synthase glutamine amidotransferase subunit HisH